jgi:geranylgeranyl diphosphate synthase, type I
MESANGQYGNSADSPFSPNTDILSFMKGPRTSPYVSFLRTFNPFLRNVLIEFKDITTSGEAKKHPLYHSILGLHKLLLAPGKRLRPYLAYQSAVIAGANPSHAMQLAGAVELYHDFALIHDDIVDSAATRRGVPTLHTIATAEHRKRGLRGDARHFGESVAVLLGDVVATLADTELQRACRESGSSILGKVWDQMRAEVLAGQLLDVSFGAATTLPTRSELLRMLAIKSGRYTIARPIQMGLALAKKEMKEEALLAFAEPLGLAFQLQDDLLSTFGDTNLGKPLDADIREGKMTLLAWETIRRIKTRADRSAWQRGFGQYDASAQDVNRVRTIMMKTGARSKVTLEVERLFNAAEKNRKQLAFKTEWLQEIIGMLRARKV